MKVFRHIQYVCGAILASLTIALAGTSASPALAEENKIPEYRLQMSPAKQDIGELKPGTTKTGTFKVQNTGSKPFDFKVGVFPYTVSDDGYSPNYDTVGKFNDIVEWVTFSQTEGTLDAGEEAEITYTITVPRDVPAGGQYAILAAETTGEKNTSGSSGIVAVRRVGMLLYSEVEGNTRRTGTVVENNIASILFNPPISATSIVENTGNVHATAEYTLQVFPFFSDEEVYTNEENPITLTVLPETRRFNTLTWTGAPHLGIFRVRQTVKIFGETSITEKIVFLCPIWFLFIILALIFCMIAWIITRIRGRNSR